MFYPSLFLFLSLSSSFSTKLVQPSLSLAWLAGWLDSFQLTTSSFQTDRICSLRKQLSQFRSLEMNSSLSNFSCSQYWLAYQSSIDCVYYQASQPASPRVMKSCGALSSWLRVKQSWTGSCWERQDSLRQYKRACLPGNSLTNEKKKKNQVQRSLWRAQARLKVN